MGALETQAPLEKGVVTMRITRIDAAGDAPRRHLELIRDGANVRAKVYEDDILAAEHLVGAGRTEDLFEMAVSIQHALDGCRGTNSMVHDYYRLSQRLAD
jgi:hypothetical protein